MRENNERLVFAPTDLSAHPSCQHLTSLNLRAARGEFERPMAFGPVIERLRQKGIEHERGYLKHLQDQYEQVVDLGDGATLEDSVAAMNSGADVIYQADLIRSMPMVRRPAPAGFG